MSTSATSEFLKAALKLADHERAALALGLLESLEHERDVDVGVAEAAWAQESARRLDEIKSGAVLPVDGADAIARVRAELRR